MEWPKKLTKQPEVKVLLKKKNLFSFFMCLKSYQSIWQRANKGDVIKEGGTHKTPKMYKSYSKLGALTLQELFIIQLQNPHD